ncbi:MAG: hypothetical protein LBW77_04775, partial [Verrucomicrobiota bacterium]|nr:hypothetical protein [Verrucomicrobiota bacterium]
VSSAAERIRVDVASSVFSVPSVVKNNPSMRTARPLSLPSAAQERSPYQKLSNFRISPPSIFISGFLSAFHLRFICGQKTPVSFLPLLSISVFHLCFIRG